MGGDAMTDLRTASWREFFAEMYKGLIMYPNFWAITRGESRLLRWTSRVIGFPICLIVLAAILLAIAHRISSRLTFIYRIGGMYGFYLLAVELMGRTTP